MSIIFMFILSSCVQLAAAGTLQPGAPLNTVDDLAGMLARTGGRLGVFIFATGLWAGALSVFIGASTGFALIVNDIGRNILSFGGKDRPGSRGNSNPEQDPLYRGAILFAVVSPLYILLTGVRPVWLVLFVTSLTLVLVPITAVGLLWITNDRARLGKHANGWITNLVLVILIATSILMAVSVWFNLHR
jgi:Mn2+/Fe2+ NRAMP family transporter